MGNIWQVNSFKLTVEYHSLV